MQQSKRRIGTRAFDAHANPSTLKRSKFRSNAASKRGERPKYRFISDDTLYQNRQNAIQNQRKIV